MKVFCRLCGQIRLPEEIKCKITDEALHIEQKLNDCCRWHLCQKRNNLPESVCISCFECLERSWSFCEKVTETQEKLINDLNENELKPYNPLEIKLEDDIIGDASSSVFDWDERDSNEHVEMDIKVEPLVLLTNVERENENVNDEIEVNTPYGDETIESQVAHKIKFLECLSLNDCNSDGTVDDRAISKLNLCNWSLFQHQCNECDQFFIDSLRLIQHHKRHHSLSVLRFKCWLCRNATENRSYISRRTLYRHIINQHIPYLAYCCKWCNKYFWDLTILKKHSPRKNRCIRDVVSIRKVICDQCGAEFSSENNLRNHQYSTHLKDELTTVYECYICRDQASFDRVHRLKYHMRKCHIGKQLVECKLCLRKLQSKSFSRHFKSHSDVKPFQCSYKDCSKQFKFLNRLQIHERTHSGERPFACRVESCDYKCSDKANIYKHMRQKHKMVFQKK